MKNSLPAKTYSWQQFRVIRYFYSQKQLVEAYYKLDPDIMDEREPGDPVLKLMPKYVK